MNNYRERCLSQKLKVCNICGEGGELVVHHLNGDREDNSLMNLLPLCKECHGRVHSEINPPGILGEIQSRLPKEALSFTSRSGGGTAERHRAMLTDRERELIGGGAEGAKDAHRYQAVSRVRKKIHDELTDDMEILEEHHPQLYQELREVVCEGDVDADS